MATDLPASKVAAVSTIATQSANKCGLPFSALAPLIGDAIPVRELFARCVPDPVPDATGDCQSGDTCHLISRHGYLFALATVPAIFPALRRGRLLDRHQSDEIQG